VSISNQQMKGAEAINREFGEYGIRGSEADPADGLSEELLDRLQMVLSEIADLTNSRQDYWESSGEVIPDTDVEEAFAKAIEKKDGS